MSVRAQMQAIASTRMSSLKPTGTHLGLLARAADAGVAVNADGVAGGEPRDADRETGAEVNEALEERILAGGAHAVGDQHSDDEAV